MIVGVVIGLGIYFKVDDIFKFIGGDVFLGMVILVLGFFLIVFGSLLIFELVIRMSESGGIFFYYEKYVSLVLVVILGLFVFFLYFLILIVIVLWVVVFYILGELLSLEL